MRHQKAVNIKNLLEASNLAQIMRKGIALHELNQQLQQGFLKQFQGLFRAVNFTQDNLTIETTNATVRQALLFRQAELLALVQQTHPEIKQLRLKVNPNLFSV